MPVASTTCPISIARFAADMAPHQRIFATESYRLRPQRALTMTAFGQRRGHVQCPTWGAKLPLTT
jgi:hypothetical protein